MKVHVFTDCDLDGAASYAVYSWYKGKAPVTVCRVNDLLKSYSVWCKSHNPGDYDQIYFLDLDTSNSDELIELIDRKNVTIIDHHTSHVENLSKYKESFAKTLIEELIINSISKPPEIKQPKRVETFIDDNDNSLIIVILLALVLLYSVACDN